MNFLPDNAGEFALVFSNLLFIFPICIAWYKGYLKHAIIYFFAALFSTNYHTCFIPQHVTSTHDYTYFKYCPFEMSKMVGIIFLILFNPRCEYYVF